jgi:hypothetical protein
VRYGYQDTLPFRTSVAGTEGAICGKKVAAPDDGIGACIILWSIAA